MQGCWSRASPAGKYSLWTCAAMVSSVSSKQWSHAGEYLRFFILQPWCTNVHAFALASHNEGVFECESVSVYV